MGRVQALVFHNCDYDVATSLAQLSFHKEPKHRLNTRPKCSELHQRYKKYILSVAKCHPKVKGKGSIHSIPHV